MKAILTLLAVTAVGYLWWDHQSSSAALQQAQDSIRAQDTAHLQSQMQEATVERDQLKRQVQGITAERDLLKLQLAQYAAKSPSPSPTPNWFQQRAQERSTALDPRPYNQTQSLLPRVSSYYRDAYGTYWMDQNGDKHYQ